MAIVAIWILPLIAFALTTDSVAGDRESGVMPLMITQAGSLFFNHGRPPYGSLSCPGCHNHCSLGRGGLHQHRAGELWSRLQPNGWLGAWPSGLICFFWIALSGIVSALARTSAGACLALTACWVGCALLIPAAIGILAETGAYAGQTPIYPGNAGTGHRPDRKSEEVAEAYYAQHPDNRPKPGVANEYDVYFIGNYYPRQLALDEAIRPFVRHMDERQQDQYRLLERFAFLSRRWPCS
jgi:hypothetical protein